MQLIQRLSEWKTIRKNINKTIGFVPTMGNLHAGHASLLKRAHDENETTVLSLFVNPTQFNDKNDYQRYPRTLDADLALAQQIGVDYVLAPQYEDLYPDNYQYQVNENSISQIMEGEYRPGHFAGMLTVVLKLLSLVQAHKAYFGEKDYQQLQLIKGLTQAFFIDTEIIGCDIIREASGLPLSSRNNLLNTEEKQLAEKFANIFKQIQLPAQEITQQLINIGIKVDYIQDYDNRRFAAVKVGNIRLIDNRIL
jgi:pantoate--beta-alanine ligase